MGNMLSSRVKGNLSCSVSDGRGVVATLTSTLILASPVWGKLGDRWGRKWMVIRAIFGLGLIVCLMALAQTPLQFFRF